MPFISYASVTIRFTIEETLYFVIDLSKRLSVKVVKYTVVSFAKVFSAKNGKISQGSRFKIQRVKE